MNYNTLGFYVGNNSGVPIYQMPGVKSSTGYTCIHVDNSGYLYATGTDCGTGNGTGNGSVTSVAISVPADESTSGGPITNAGSIAITRNAQAPNTFLAGPSSGGNAVPAYRTLVSADVSSQRGQHKRQCGHGNQLSDASYRHCERQRRIRSRRGQRAQPQRPNELHHVWKRQHLHMHNLTVIHPGKAVTTCKSTSTWQTQAPPRWP